jgi:hypothetical protein
MLEFVEQSEREDGKDGAKVGVELVVNVCEFERGDGSWVCFREEDKKVFSVLVCFNRLDFVRDRNIPIAFPSQPYLER